MPCPRTVNTASLWRKIQIKWRRPLSKCKETVRKGDFMSAGKKGPFWCKRWVCKSNIYRGRTSPGVTRTGQGVTWARQQRRGHAHGCPNEKYHSSPQNQIKSRNFSSTNRSFLIKIQDLVGFCCGTVLATREGQGHAADGAVDGLEFVGQFSRITPWNFGIPPWHRSSHTGRSGACRRRIVLVTREGLRMPRTVPSTEWSFVGSFPAQPTRRGRGRARGLVGSLVFSCLVRRTRRRWMRPFARMPWHCGGWYVPRCWIWPKRGRVSGIAGVCVCWLRALAPNGEHGIPYRNAKKLCGRGTLCLQGKRDHSDANVGCANQTYIGGGPHLGGRGLGKA